MKDELIDIYDADSQYLHTALKSVAHKEGLWHRVFTGILVNPEKKIVYLQKKYAGQYSFNRPDYIDISVGGHYLAGEDIQEGIREIKEEIGLDINFKDLIPIGVRQTSAVLAEDYKNNEFQFIFIIPCTQQLQDFHLNNLEVKSLIEIPIEAGLALLNKEVKNLTVQTLIVNKFGKSTIQNLEISLKDFVPAYLHKDELLKRLFVAALRWTNKEDTRFIYW